MVLLCHVKAALMLLHHIIVRGIERREIFKDDTGRNFFGDRLGKMLSETDTKCFAWVLIPDLRSLALFP
jgi:hypothetical protein